MDAVMADDRKRAKSGEMKMTIFIWVHWLNFFTETCVQLHQTESKNANWNRSTNNEHEYNKCGKIVISLPGSNVKLLSVSVSLFFLFSHLTLIWPLSTMHVYAQQMKDISEIIMSNTETTKLHSIAEHNISISLVVGSSSSTLFHPL